MAVETVWAGIVYRQFPEIEKSAGKHTISKAATDFNSALPYCFSLDFKEKPYELEANNREFCGKGPLLRLSKLRRILLGYKCRVAS